MPDYDEYFLVTGGAGFIGSHFLDYFVVRYPNYHFTCIDKLNYATNENTNSLSKVMESPNFTFIKMDLSTEYTVLYNFLVTEYKKNKITNIIHFAAESCVDRSFSNPLYFTTNNILGTQNLLECSRLLILNFPDVKDHFRFIHISTDEVYGEQHEGETVDESSKLNPTNPYAATKAACDLILKSYYYSYKIPVTSIRSNNVYGPRQYPEKIIPMTLNKLKEYVRQYPNSETMAHKIKIHGNGSNKRAYLHIQDFIQGIALIWKKFKEEQATAYAKEQVINQTFNIGSEDEIDNLSLVKFICDNYLSKKLSLSNLNYSNYIEFIKDRNYNDSRYSIDYNKIKQFGWKPTIDLKSGIIDLIDHLL